MLALLLALVLPAWAQDTAEPPPPPIVGGTEAPAGKWNDTAAIMFGGQSGCTGTLIGPRTVLTAAHCTGGISHVLLGATDWLDDSQGELIAVTEEIRHPNYRSFGNDIAVLKLAETSTYLPRAISDGCTDGLAVNGATTMAVGFGSTRSDGGGFNSKLWEVEVPVTDAECTDTQGCDFNAPAASEIVAGGDGFDSCNGDSGGPLYLETPYGYVLIGVTSRPHYEGSVACGDGGVYTRPDAYLDWIRQVSGDTIATPTCNAPPEVVVDAYGPVGNRGDTKTSYAVIDPDSVWWTYEIAVQPANGVATVDPARQQLVYTGDQAYVGADEFVFRVTDDAGNITDVTVAFGVVEGRGGCGCATGTGTTGLWSVLFAPVLLRRRRR